MRRKWNGTMAYITANQWKRVKENDVILYRPDWASGHLALAKVIKKKGDFASLIEPRQIPSNQRRYVHYERIAKVVTKHYPEILL